ncbi:MAG: phosphatidate cytidylyltransferase, partial [Saprospiraceae bacterium]|nr:phosphatidate cytidylyltransferase [Saprospiraceae bacterium]
GLAPNWTAAFLAAMLILSGLFILELFAAAPRPFDNVARLALVIAYIGLPIALLDWIAFRGGSYDLTLPLGLLLLTWISDTAAYLVGSRFGRRLLFPRISPKKTWEGTVGGGLLTIGLSLLFAELLGELSSGQWAVLALLVVIFGSLGDLVESMLKRSRGVKDSGTLLPGHGGVLDRFDAFIFLLPWAAAYLWWIG